MWLYLVFLLLTIISGDLFGILEYPVDALDLLLDLAVGVASIVIGVMALGGRTVVVPARR